MAGIEELIEEVLRGKRGAWQEFSQVVESVLQEMLWHWFRADTSASSADTHNSDDSDRSETEDPEEIKPHLIDVVKRRLRADKFAFLATILGSCRMHADNPVGGSFSTGWDSCFEMHPPRVRSDGGARTTEHGQRLPLAHGDARCTRARRYGGPRARARARARATQDHGREIA